MILDDNDKNLIQLYKNIYAYKEKINFIKTQYLLVIKKKDLFVFYDELTIDHFCYKNYHYNAIKKNIKPYVIFGLREKLYIKNMKCLNEFKKVIEKLYEKEVIYEEFHKNENFI